VRTSSKSRILSQLRSSANNHSRNTPPNLHISIRESPRQERPKATTITDHQFMSDIVPRDPVLAPVNHNRYTDVAPTVGYEQVSGYIEVGTMNRRQADALIGLLAAAVLLIGGGLSWQAYQRQQAFEQMGSMMGMDSSVGAIHGTNPVWYIVGTLFVSAVIGGGYLLIRNDLTNTAEPTDTEAKTESQPSSVRPSNHLDSSSASSISCDHSDQQTDSTT